VISAGPWDAGLALSGPTEPALSSGPRSQASESEEDRGYAPLGELDAALLDFLKPLDLSGSGCSQRGLLLTAPGPPAGMPAGP